MEEETGRIPLTAESLKKLGFVSADEYSILDIGSRYLRAVAVGDGTFKAHIVFSGDESDLANTLQYVDEVESLIPQYHKALRSIAESHGVDVSQITTESLPDGAQSVFLQGKLIGNLSYNFDHKAPVLDNYIKTDWTYKAIEK